MHHARRGGLSRNKQQPDRHFHHHSPAHMDECAIADEGRVQCRERIALNIQIPPKLFLSGIRVFRVLLFETGNLYSGRKGTYG